MGLYDTVELYDGVRLPDYPATSRPPYEVDWQTKGIDRPRMERYRITANGILLQEELHYEEVPPEDRPYASRDDVDEDDFRYACGSLKRVHDGWIERDEFHGRFSISSTFETVDGLVTYRVTFTHGQLERFERTH